MEELGGMGVAGDATGKASCSALWKKDRQLPTKQLLEERRG